MKKILVVLGFIICLPLAVTAQKFNDLDKSPADIVAYPSSYRESMKKVRVIYSRPQLNGRLVATLAPEGKVWRTGANEAPEITFYEDVKIGGKPVKAGTYALFTIPGEKEWTIILNKNLNQWGAYSYDQSADVVRVKASVTQVEEELEPFSMAFKEVDNGAHLVMGWGQVRVAIPMSW